MKNRTNANKIQADERAVIAYLARQISAGYLNPFSD